MNYVDFNELCEDKIIIRTFNEKKILNLRKISYRKAFEIKISNFIKIENQIKNLWLKDLINLIKIM